MSHRSARAYALIAGLLGLATLSLLVAGPAGARIPPDHQDGSPTIVRHVTTAGPFWTYAVVAVAALLIGVAGAYAIARIRFNGRLARAVAAPA